MKTFALLLLIATPLVAADPKYDIAYRFFAAPGKPVHVRSHFVGNDTASFVDPDGKEMTKTMPPDESEKEFVEKVLKVEDDEATEFTRLYAKPADKSYSGRLVHFVRKNGAVEATADGAEPKELQRLADSQKTGTKIDRALLPQKPVAVGEAWVIDTAAAMPTSLGEFISSIDHEHSKATGKLVSVTRENGHQIATVDITLDLVSQSGMKGVSFTTPVHATIRMEGAIDGGAFLRSSFALAFRAEQPYDANGHQIVIKHDMKFAEEKQREEAP